MAKAETTRSNRGSRAPQRQTYTLELATALCPDDALAPRLSRTFGLSPVNAASIRETIEEHVVRAANELVDNLNERAMAMHLQRIVAAYVASACGAGQFYSQKVSQAQQLATRLFNDERDEDRGGPSGHDDRATKARNFAAETGLQAYALLAAAQGAVSAYAHVTGEDWKPYEPSQPGSQSVSRRAADAEIAAFNR